MQNKTKNPNKFVPANVKSKFIDEVSDYCKKVKEVVEGYSTEMPEQNLNDILEKYIKIGMYELEGNGLLSARNRRVSKETFNDLMESTMTEINK